MKAEGIKQVVAVDITSFLSLTDDDKEQGRKVVLHWREPDGNQLREHLPAAQALLKGNATWTYGMAALVAALAACHVAPQPDGVPPMDFYAMIIGGGNVRLATFLEDELWHHFPQLKQNMGCLWPLLETAQPIAPPVALVLPIEQMGGRFKRKGKVVTNV